ncbi:MAG: carbon starvation protein A [Clostridia bacterium]|nr:carbon starvation protein A [Clostridia bacterium]
MISLLIAFGLLIVGYILYGRLVERTFAPDDRETPAIAVNDGVDCVPMKTWKAYLVQLLNIAGTGPIFGALMGAEFGPVVFIWIVAGSILGGAVHDYMTGMISSRHGGESIAELSGIYLGKTSKWIMRVFSVVLLVLVGTVFVTSPATLVASLTPGYLGKTFWIIVILVYYTVATIVPIDKLIGRLYPVFGAILIIMAAGILGCLAFSGRYTVPEFSFANMSTDGKEVWPYMFVTVACGAVSGFHATQSPMIAKCIKHERDGRRVFYGAMISEAVIALVWAAAGVAFYETSGALSEAISSLGPSGVAYEISFGMMGKIGGILAVIGVVVCPITSGDTAFRSARLVLAEWFGMNQKKLSSRLVITLPLLAVGAVLTGLDFDVLWRYFSWSNQTLAMVALWVATAYLVTNGKTRLQTLLTAIPATFMTAVSMTYILMADEGLKLGAGIGYPIGAAIAVCLFCIYVVLSEKHRRKV